MAKRRLGFELALPVALVALALGVSGCGGSSGTGTGGTGGGGGKAGAGGKGGGSGGSTVIGGSSGGGDTGTSGGGTSGVTGGSSGGGTSGGGTSGGTGGHAGNGGTGGHATTDGGQDAARDAASDSARDAEAIDAHHADASTDAHQDGATDAAPICTNACVLGSHRCASGGSETCMVTSSGCTVWGSAAPCLGATSCLSGTGLCACPAAPAGCSAAGTFCDSTGDLVTCTRDAQGCFSASAPQACPTHETCHGGLPNAACACDNDAQCNGTNAFCLNSSTVATCGVDSNTPACNVVLSTQTCHGSSTCAGGACICPAVGTTAGTGCTTLNATACSATDILTCVTESASGCSIWQASTHCGTGGLTCGTKAGAGPACQCPENAGTDVYVDPTMGSDVAGGLFPTGVQSPASCRYATLTNGLTKVGSPGRVVAISAGLPVTFTGETFPLVVRTGVSLITADATFNPADYTIAFGGGTTAVTLADGSALRGFTIDAGAAATAAVSCISGAVTLDTDLLSGGGFVTNGLNVTGSCSPTLQSVSIVDFVGAALNVGTSGSVGITGGLLSASLIGLAQSTGTVSATGLTVQNNGQYGVRLSGTGSPALTLAGQSVVDTNGTTGTFAGISVAKGTVSVTDTQIAGNGGAGIELASPGTSLLNTVQVMGNGTKGASPGVSVTSGTLVASALGATSNTADGVSISGGSATLTTSTASQNAGNGVTFTSSGTLDVSGGTFSSNTGAGISGSAGTVTIHGSTTIAGNGTGVQLLGAAASVTGATIQDNTGSGVLVNESTGSTVLIGSSATTTTIATNHQVGVLVQSAPPVSGSGANSVTIDTATIKGNQSFGVYLQGNAGSVAATIKGTAITGNADAGLMIEQGLTTITTEAIQNNDISGNNTKTSPRNVGGILFNTSSTLASFIGNTVHSNGGDELGFNALPNGGTKWVITPPSNACDATANSIYCYGTGNVGVHVLSGLTSVDAQHQHWANNPPTPGIDTTGTVTATNPCSALTTCP